MNLNQIKELNDKYERQTAFNYKFARIILGILVACICAFFLFSCNYNTHYNQAAIKDLKTGVYKDLSVHQMHKVGDTVTYNYRTIGTYQIHDRAVIVKIYSETERTPVN